MTEPGNEPRIYRGLKDVYFERSGTTFIDGKAGELRYRGYSIHDLAAHSCFEETAYLLIHGELDDNPGTFPLQTRRLFHALQGLGGTARMVILPHEAHGYQARESILHANYETSAWLAAHLEPPKASPAAADP